MRNKIQAPGKQVLHKQVPKAQALQKEKDPRLVAVGGFGQVVAHSLIIAQNDINRNTPRAFSVENLPWMAWLCLYKKRHEQEFSYR